jgi:hypothetical protein
MASQEAAWEAERPYLSGEIQNFDFDALIYTFTCHYHYFA